MANLTSLYKRHKTIYTDPVSGKFNNIRILSMSFMALTFFIMPWIKYGDRQALIFDVSCIRFYFFNLIFWPQDFIFFAILGIILIIVLFTITVYVGRVWCGFLCPQSVWIRMTNFISRLIEGNRNKRFKLDNTKFSYGFFYKKIIKHMLFLILSLFTSITFIGYFVPIEYLVKNLIFLSLNSLSCFWEFFFTVLVYFNIYWFKEQFCFLACPYARLQSMMFDENTLIVTYDEKRGEKRGSRNKTDDHRLLGLGDCINCKKCVTCCPTGIDIRNGLQIECISCGACIDACNEVMEKMGYEKNLIKYSKENTNNKKINIRLFAYLSIILILLVILLNGLMHRDLIQMNVTRSQIQLYNLTEDNLIENFYVFKIVNKTSKSNIYKISLLNEGFKYTGLETIILNGEETLLLDIKVSISNSEIKNKFTEIYFKIHNFNNNSEFMIKKNKFISPK
jgi:cytochrome c oxidase accessory protein FixG